MSIEVSIRACYSYYSMKIRITKPNYNITQKVIVVKRNESILL
ncbi:hypothetical protein NBRC111894_425 [Sporolactobacillus inulinus]|uniref:Uncharacterized protein n=1 Tax=Sporolactobacillus inulinus TaxID=2078 RepID=A0A4Y1Z7K7_9BACL|nr:hypothetical protein NBRC111894_425 [Sporolactobacillus inulinus]